MMALRELLEIQISYKMAKQGVTRPEATKLLLKAANRGLRRAERDIAEAQFRLTLTKRRKTSTNGSRLLGERKWSLIKSNGGSMA